MGKKLSLNGMERILLRDHHIKAIKHDKPKEVPEINSALFAPPDREGDNERIECLKEFLDSPYIIDDFGIGGEDHDLRREWRQQMEDRYTWFRDYYLTNALKINRILEASTSLRHLQLDYIGTNKRKFKELVGRKQALSNKKYDPSMNLNERIRYVKGLKDLVYDVLIFLSEQRPKG